MRQQVHAVELGCVRLAGERDGGGRDVEADHRVLEDLTARNSTRPCGHEGHADAAFADHAFLTEQGQVERAVAFPSERRAVVAEEKDERVFRLARFLELLAHAANAVVNRGDESEG